MKGSPVRVRASAPHENPAKPRLARGFVVVTSALKAAGWQRRWQRLMPARSTTSTVARIVSGFTPASGGRNSVTGEHAATGHRTLRHSSPATSSSDQSGSNQAVGPLLLLGLSTASGAGGRIDEP